MTPSSHPSTKPGQVQGLAEAELAEWLSVAETMATGLDLGTGRFEQSRDFSA